MNNTSPISPIHGATQLTHASVDDYSLEIEDEQGMLGDQASQTAFRQILKAWQCRIDAVGPEKLTGKSPDQLSTSESSGFAARGDADSTPAVNLAAAEFANRLAYVIGQFVRHPAWMGVERIAIGGGFKESDAGKLVIRQAGQRCADEGLQVELCLLHHAADDAGLIGWTHLLAPDLQGAQAILAIDIGGTNVRCGIVQFGDSKTGNWDTARVTKREKWRYGGAALSPGDVIDGILEMLRRLVDHATTNSIRLSPFIGVACPGVIRCDGSIGRGTQNLPGDWQNPAFHFPSCLGQRFLQLTGVDATVSMHNDAVVQGLSELPYMRDVRRWGVLTIGTGLGNASFTNRF